MIKCNYVIVFFIQICLTLCLNKNQKSYIFRYGENVDLYTCQSGIASTFPKLPDFLNIKDGIRIVGKYSNFYENSFTVTCLSGEKHSIYVSIIERITRFEYNDFMKINSTHSRFIPTIKGHVTKFEIIKPINKSGIILNSQNGQIIINKEENLKNVVVECRNSLDAMKTKISVTEYEKCNFGFASNTLPVFSNFHQNVYLYNGKNVDVISEEANLSIDINPSGINGYGNKDVSNTILSSEMSECALKFNISLKESNFKNVMANGAIAYVFPYTADNTNSMDLTNPISSIVLPEIRVIDQQTLDTIIKRLFHPKLFNGFILSFNFITTKSLTINSKNLAFNIRTSYKDGDDEEITSIYTEKYSFTSDSTFSQSITMNIIITSNSIDPLIKIDYQNSFFHPHISPVEYNSHFINCIVGEPIPYFKPIFIYNSSTIIKIVDISPKLPLGLYMNNLGEISGIAELETGITKHQVTVQLADSIEIFFIYFNTLESPYIKEFFFYRTEKFVIDPKWIEYSGVEYKILDYRSDLEINNDGTITGQIEDVGVYSIYIELKKAVKYVYTIKINIYGKWRC